MAHATDIVGWAYEADVHCNDCAQERFAMEEGSSLSDYNDREGNPVTPIFDTEDAYETCHHCTGSGICEHDNKSHNCPDCDGAGTISRACGDCGEPLVED